MNNMCGNNSRFSMFIFVKTRCTKPIGIFGFQTSVYNIYFICLNAIGVILLVYSVVDGFALAVCHVFASCFDRLAGFYSAIKLLPRP